MNNTDLAPSGDPRARAAAGAASDPRLRVVGLIDTTALAELTPQITAQALQQPARERTC
jgi:hypothetical protein